ncbi:flagellar basal body rod C-terminal domain-containing protein [Methylobrevis pamukkalensis]|nr:flagellar basal body rod C-terminal domain-containing protein [Methylobrevis pamukkalensis]
MRTSLAGMTAASSRFEASAGRVAAAGVSGPMPAGTDAPTAPGALQPAPSGGVAMPEVSFAAEAVEQMTAKAAYQASVATFRAANEMTRDVLDLLA